MPNNLTGLSGGIKFKTALNLTTSTNATAFGEFLDIKTGTASFQIADSGVGAVNLEKLCRNASQCNRCGCDAEHQQRGGDDVCTEHQCVETAVPNPGGLTLATLTTAASTPGFIRCVCSTTI